MPATIVEALKKAGVGYAHLDGIAVTQGPGMPSSLGIGLTAAKTLAAVLEKPLIYVHHMQAHALTPLLTEEVPPTFPFITLLVSGGHTLLVLVRGIQDFAILATTTDDSIGDAFDKVARELHIPWQHSPGAGLEAFAASEDRSKAILEAIGAKVSPSEPLAFPVPLRGKPSFSFSGLKSAVSRYIQELGRERPIRLQERRDIARAFQVAACAQLEDKLAMTLHTETFDKKRKKDYPRIDLGVKSSEIRSVVCSGGVAANRFLRKRLRMSLNAIGREDVQLAFPPLSLCTDNAAMIAFAGHLLWSYRTTDYTRTALPKWPINTPPSLIS